jgi:stage V sporulation protein K
MKNSWDDYGSSDHSRKVDQVDDQKAGSELSAHGAQESQQAVQFDFFADYPQEQRGSSVAQVDRANGHSVSAIQDRAASEASTNSAPEGSQMQECSDDLAALLGELDQLIGLRRVKTEVRRLIQYVRVQNMRRARGIARSRMALHSVFYGSPGTGKTTVARLYGRMLRALGLLSSGHLIETDRAGLVANYIGQTATKTDSKVQEALGGVLFIDEAYALSRGEGTRWDYGSEAIEVLMKRMEDHRDNLVVIAAGYPEPMDEFLRSNEGLRSRFSTYVHFDDYTPEEMLDIFRLFCLQENYELDEEASELVLAAIEYRYAIRDKTFGNARYVRNLFETVIRNHALRVGSTQEEPTVTDLRLIQPQDVPLITDRDM